MVSNIPASRTCVACEEVEGKYKCPKCLKYTCSLACTKQHREAHEADQPQVSSGQSTVSASEEHFSEHKNVNEASNISDISLTNTGEVRDDSSADQGSGTRPPDDIHTLFQKYPDLPYTLRAIADATDPPAPESTPGSSFTTPTATMMAPGRHQQQRYGSGRKGAQPWTKEIGVQNGLAAMRRALSEDRSGALHEYYELQRMLLAREREERAEAAFRKDLLRQDADLIRTLMQQEGEHD